MPKYNFKSNIKCVNCEAKVREVLDKKDEIESFKVDLYDVDRSVIINTSTKINEQTIINWVKESGFQLISKKSFLKKLFK